MGAVYRAIDTNLKRAVALKVLPEAVAADSERVARFRREAEVLAALNHPNIAAIYGIEKSGSTMALVMELIGGPTLADRIDEGPIPSEEVLLIAKQIAEALAAAHEQGIIHRDLKPVNVKLRHDGTVKVLDFGLAKAVAPSLAPSSDLADSPTITWFDVTSGWLAAAHRLAGDDERADAVLEAIGPAPRLIWGRVVYHMLLSELDAAADWFERMVERRDPFALLYAATPTIAPLWTRHRWAQLAEQMKLPWRNGGAPESARASARS